MKANQGSAKHEAFEIKSTPLRRKIVRQDRLDVRDESCFIEINGHEKHQIVNFGAFGLAYVSKVQPLPGTEMTGQFIYNNYEIGDLKIRAVRSVEDPEGIFTVACEIMGEPLDVAYFRAIREAHKVLQSHNLQQMDWSQIPLEFRCQVYDLREYLEVLQTKVNSYQEENKHAPLGDIAKFEDTFTEVIGAQLGDFFAPKYEQFAKTLSHCSEEQKKTAVKFFRSKLETLIYQAPFANRSYYKPLGYAGDYEMMNIIYRNEAVGQSLFAKCLQRYFVGEPAARAVQNRSVYLEQKIRQTVAANTKSKLIRLLSVASGPAFEVERFMRNCNEFRDLNIEFHLLDQDEHSLKHAQHRLEKLRRELGLGYKIIIHNQAIKNVIGRGLEETGFDLIYSAGLFDYFSDPVARMAGERLFAGVNKGGRVIIGNFDTSNPTQFLMEMALDWNLVYRSEKDMTELFKVTGGDLIIEKEELGINLFCVITK